ncbi:unnamed protein product [marine sediment metagenome]|uniref:NAD-dependent epimerase/dehydratase domain-containing protein n=1 Tax=marine sediment metagenome TaxID=412755 RepID=X1S473_9ZZZZ
MNRRVLITGEAGFVGGHLISSLLETETRITAIDIAKPRPELLSQCGERVNWVQANLITDNLSEYLDGIDTVYHLAAKFLPGTSEQVLSELCELNVDGTRNVAKVAVSSGVQNFIHISSVAACEGFDGKIITEETGKPITSYGYSKLKSEQIVKEIAGDKMRYVIFRPVALFGESHLGSIFEMVKAIKNKKYIIIGTGKNHVNFLYVKDLVDVLLKAATGSVMANQVYIVADAPITLGKLTNCMKKELNLPPSRFNIPKPLGLAIGFGFDIIAKLLHRPMLLSVNRVRAMTRDIFYSNDKLKEQLSVNFKYGIRLGLARTIKWYKSQGLLG